MAIVRVLWLEDQRLQIGTFEDIKRACASGFAWVDVSDPDAESLGQVGEIFGLHPLALEDCLHSQLRPKIESYQSGLFIVWLSAYDPDGDDVPTRELDVFLGKNHLVTVHSGELDEVNEVVVRSDDLLTNGGDFVLHAIVDRLVDRVLLVSDGLSDELDEIEDRLLGDPQPADLEALYRVRRRLVKLHKLIGPERDIIRALSRERDLIDEEAYRYLQDVGDHLARVEDSIETTREVAAAAMDIYLSSVSNRLNAVMKVLTIVATIFMPLTLISGIYGMNLVRGMWPPVRSPWSFWVVCLAMVVIAAWMIWFFRRRKWW